MNSIKTKLTVIRQPTATMVVRNPVPSMKAISLSMMVSVSSNPVRHRFKRKIKHPDSTTAVTALMAFMARVSPYILSRSGNVLIDNLHNKSERTLQSRRQRTQKSTYDSP